MSTVSVTPHTIPTGSAERRAAPRRQPAVGTVYRFDSDDGGPAALALVWNISATGISVLVPEPRAAGTVLTGYLEKTEGDHMHRVALHVIHAKRLESGDFFLGAHFDRPLAADELKPFVAEG
jgi:hypothetical protein